MHADEDGQQLVACESTGLLRIQIRVRLSNTVSYI